MKKSVKSAAFRAQSDVGKTKRKTVIESTGFPTTFSKKNGHILINANTVLPIIITEEHVERAICGNAAECVIAQALRDHFGPLVDGFQVGPYITKIIMGNRVVRYTTPTALRNTLKIFDLTGQWHLPPGQYRLLPLSKSYRRPNRWHKVRRSGGKRSYFKGTRALPTRHALTVCQIMAIPVG